MVKVRLISNMNLFSDANLALVATIVESLLNVRPVSKHKAIIYP
jgi:hypothetical protein